MATKQQLGSRHGGAMKLATQDITPDYSGLRYDYRQIAAEHREEVMQAAVQIKANSDRVRDSIFAIGNRLLEVKDHLPHGEFGEWLRVEFDLSVRMAQNMMNVAREYGGKSETVSLLSDSVLYLLAAPSTPTEAREEVEQQVGDTGKPPTRREVKRVIAKHRPAPELPPAKVVYVEPTPAPSADETPPDLHAAGYLIVRSPEGETYRWLNDDGEVGDWWPLEQAVEDARQRVQLAPSAKPEPDVTTPADLAEKGVTLHCQGGNWGYVWQQTPMVTHKSGHYASKSGAVAAARKYVLLATQAASTVATEPEPPATPATWPTLPDDLAALGFEYRKVGKEMWAICRESGNYQSNWHYVPTDCIPDVRDYLATRPAAQPVEIEPDVEEQSIVEILIDPAAPIHTIAPGGLHHAIQHATVEELQAAVQRLPDELRRGREPVLLAALKKRGAEMPALAVPAMGAGQAAEPQPTAETLTLTLPRVIVERLHAALLVHALRQYMSAGEQAKLKTALEEVLW